MRAGCLLWGVFLYGTSVSAQFYVAPGGADSNPGTLAAPFQTLEKARFAMRGSAVKTTFLRARRYLRSSAFALLAEDSGTTWRFYVPDGVDSAVLDGAGKVAGGIIAIKGGANITIDGLKIENFVDYGIIASGGPHSEFGDLPAACSNTVRNCDVGVNTATSWSSGGISFIGAAPGTTIENNYVHDVGSQGIAINTWHSAADSIAGSIVVNNVVIRAVQRMYDGGGIYVGMHGGFQAPIGGVLVSNNFVRGQGAPGLTGPYGASHIGIYIDDNANGVVVTGNIVGPPSENSVNEHNLNNVTAFLIHNGHDNHIYGNIADLGDSGRVLTAVWGFDSDCRAGMAGNSFTRNIVISRFGGNQQTSSSGVRCYSYMQNKRPASDFLIQNNVYYNYGGGQARTDGPIVSDSNPVVADPKLSGWACAVASDSPAHRAPVSFPEIAGRWGPPGFVIPEEGAPPSCLAASK
jgi:hypothetical protein